MKSIYASLDLHVNSCELMSPAKCPLTAEQITVAKNESIDFSDIPELDDEFWERAKVAESDRTDQITMRVITLGGGLFRGSGDGLPDAK